MTMWAEFYEMIASTGEDPCEDGVGTYYDDGTFGCLIAETNTIDNLISDSREGPAIERIDDTKIRFSFDLTEFKEAVTEGSETDPSVMWVLQESFLGHHIHVKIKGEEIIRTNGTLSDGGTTAEIDIPMTVLLETDETLPDVFEAIIRTE
ncbi:hypothetical protein P0082_04445 [Candidatus Haliotispira prima]|uniref:Lipocalin-like domain-containing protein n=1 Tax=Candidatus Haliotispira prima TaxID=3034016 RepID=A0ABY8MJB7_9SPIO|nr:hypothetical protein P0082_04445 [Candidatus Haliotispira prima]